MSSRKIENRINVLKTVVAISVSYLFAAIIILLVSDDPGKAISSFVIGPFTTMRRFGNVIEGMIPLVFAGVGVSIMYSASFFNLAASGSFYMSAVVASYIALQVMPAGIHPLVGILFSGITGAAICVVPAILKVKWDINEVVSALMVNYIVTYMGSYVLRFILFDEKAGFMASKVFQPTVALPVLVEKTHIHLGIVITAAVVVFAFIFLFKSKWGYAIRMTGSSKNCALYAGIGVTSAIMVSQLIGGFIVGIGGASEMYGMYTRFQWTTLPTTGFDGVIVAAMARRNPAMVPFAAFFLSYIRVGADIMARNSNVASEIVSIIQAIIIVMIGAEYLLANMKKKAILKNSLKNMESMTEN